MNNYISLDGNKIEISDETAENFRKQFGQDKYDVYLKKNPIVFAIPTLTYEAFRTTIEYDDFGTISERDVIQVSTPITNNKWYENAFKWAINFVKQFPETYIWMGPDKQLYILLP